MTTNANISKLDLQPLPVKWNYIQKLWKTLDSIPYLIIEKQLGPMRNILCACL